ncbi:MAG: hypothetical protein K2X97_20530 [Mycobacteriaceae bacterium]|nr:hypothetical protein [Mycobacteriaceae bacterium]
MTQSTAISRLRLRIGALTETRRDEYLAALDEALTLPEGRERDNALRRLSARTLRAEALDKAPRMQRSGG